MYFADVQKCCPELSRAEEFARCLEIRADVLNLIEISLREPAGRRHYTEALLARWRNRKDVTVSHAPAHTYIWRALKRTQGLREEVLHCLKSTEHCASKQIALSLANSLN